MATPDQSPAAPTTTTMTDELTALIDALHRAGIPLDAIGGQLLVAAHSCFTMAGGDELALSKFENAVGELRRHYQASGSAVRH